MNAHPLNMELHILLRAALDLLLYFPHRSLDVNNAFLGDATRQLAGWWENKSHVDEAIICVGGRENEKGIPLNNNWHFQRQRLTVIAEV